MLKIGQVDYENFIPELARGLPLYDEPINWEALRLVLEVMEGSPLQKRLAGERFLKTIKRRGIGVLTPRFRLSYVTARLALGDFSDYWGWEFRGAYDQGDSQVWAAEMYWAETWMPKWGGGNVDTLVILGEQGIGDQVFFASIIPEAMIRAKNVIYECDPRLHSLLERSLPGLQCVPQRHFEDRRLDYGMVNAFIPAGDLMRMFRRSQKHFPGKPYLKPDPDKLEKYRKFSSFTGVAWGGRQGWIEPSNLGIENPISVNYGSEIPSIPVPPFNLKDDIEDIVALCCNLEKIVTVPQSVHHFAGAAGCKVDIILPEKMGAVQNQLKWDCSPRYNNGKLIWYKDCQIYNTVKEWKSQSTPK